MSRANHIQLERAAKPRKCRECGRDTDPNELMIDDEGRESCVGCDSDARILVRESEES